MLRMISPCPDAWRKGAHQWDPVPLSTPNLREHAKPLYNGSLNNSGIIRALFDETLSPLESGDSGSEELEDELEQIGA